MGRTIPNVRFFTKLYYKIAFFVETARNTVMTAGMDYLLIG